MAETVEVVVPGVWRWHVWNDRIDFESDAHAVSDEGGNVLIDPLPLQENALKKLEPIIAICLTAACHQRSAWRYRRAYGVQVYAPEVVGRWTRNPTRRIGWARRYRAA